MKPVGCGLVGAWIPAAAPGRCACAAAVPTSTACSTTAVSMSRMIESPRVDERGLLPHEAVERVKGAVAIHVVPDLDLAVLGQALELVTPRVGLEAQVDVAVLVLIPALPLALVLERVRALFILVREREGITAERIEDQRAGRDKAIQTDDASIRVRQQHDLPGVRLVDEPERVAAGDRGRGIGVVRDLGSAGIGSAGIAGIAWLLRRSGIRVMDIRAEGISAAPAGEQRETQRGRYEK